MFQSTRIAPVQICLFIRGVPCAGDKIDYYLVPAESQAAYLRAVPAADLKAKMTVSHTDTPIYRGNKSSSRADESANAERQNPSVRKFNRSVRPAWMEVYPDQQAFPIPLACYGIQMKVKGVSLLNNEQVLLVDWPLMTRALIQDIMASATESSGPTDDQQSEKQFSPLDIEGQVDRLFNTYLLHTYLPTFTVSNGYLCQLWAMQVFFDGQPVALLPVYPSQLHPLMDEVLFKIMRTVPELHLVLVLPDCYYTHTTDYKNKISWARKLVRRLWTKYLTHYFTSPALDNSSHI